MKVWGDLKRQCSLNLGMEPMGYKACIVHKGHSSYMRNEETVLGQPVHFCPQQGKWSAYLINSAAAVHNYYESDQNDSTGSFSAQRLAAGEQLIIDRVLELTKIKQPN